jgi:hypothetical protein
MGWGSLGLASFGPGAAPQRGSGDLNRGSRWRPRWRAGPAAWTHACVGSSSDGACTSSSSRREQQLRGYPSYWRELARLRVLTLVRR